MLMHSKLGRNAPQAHIVRETNPSSPQRSCMVSTHTGCFPPGKHCKDCNCFFPLSFCLLTENPSRQNAALGLYFKDGAFWNIHLCCRTNETAPGVLSMHTVREVQASLVYYEWRPCPNTCHIRGNVLSWVFVWDYQVWALLRVVNMLLLSLSSFEIKYFDFGIFLLFTQSQMTSTLMDIFPTSLSEVIL